MNYYGKNGHVESITTEGKYGTSSTVTVHGKMTKEELQDIYDKHNIGGGLGYVYENETNPCPVNYDLDKCSSKDYGLTCESCHHYPKSKDPEVFYIIYTTIERKGINYPAYLLEINDGKMTQSNLYDASKYLSEEKALAVIESLLDSYTDGRVYEVISIDKRIFGATPKWVVK